MKTFGIVVDLKAEKGLDFAMDVVANMQNSDFTKLVDTSMHTKMRFIVAAGRFGHDSLIGLAFNDPKELKQAFSYANSCMKSSGGELTAWVIYPKTFADILQ